MMISMMSRCRGPVNVSKEYCQKLRLGLSRLRSGIRSQYEEMFPDGFEQIAEAMKEAEEAAWATPFPSLFFPPMAHLKIRERMLPS